jgi:hypothetical protein
MTDSRRQEIEQLLTNYDKACAAPDAGTNITETGIPATRAALWAAIDALLKDAVLEGALREIAENGCENSSEELCADDPLVGPEGLRNMCVPCSAQAAIDAALSPAEGEKT